METRPPPAQTESEPQPPRANGNKQTQKLPSSQTVPANGAREVKTGSVTIQVWIATTE